MEWIEVHIHEQFQYIKPKGDDNTTNPKVVRSETIRRIFKTRKLLNSKVGLMCWCLMCKYFQCRQLKAKGNHLVQTVYQKVVLSFQRGEANTEKPTHQLHKKEKKKKGNSIHSMIPSDKAYTSTSPCPLYFSKLPCRVRLHTINHEITHMKKN